MYPVGDAPYKELQDQERMFSQVWMKLLERRPDTYDRRMDRLSRGHLSRVRAEVCQQIWDAGCGRVLEIGCGTGQLAATLATRCQLVEAFDVSEAMVARAQQRAAAAQPGGTLKVWQMGVEGMDRLPAAVHDAVLAVLVFSELSDPEQRYALEHARRVLRPGGLLLLADEVVPRTAARRWVQRLARAPQAAATYLVTGAGTRPLLDPAGQLRQAGGLELLQEQRSLGDRFCLLLARRGAGEETP